MAVPYENATSGHKARGEIYSMLERFGCSRIGFMDEVAEQAVILAFEHRGRNVQLRASAKGWAAMWLKEHPWSSRARATRTEHEQKALRQGQVAINSILRDWVKGQITAIETGILTFEAVFVPHMLTADGRTMIEVMDAKGLLPKPEGN